MFSFTGLTSSDYIHAHSLDSAARVFEGIFSVLWLLWSEMSISDEVYDLAFSSIDSLPDVFINLA